MNPGERTEPSASEDLFERTWAVPRHAYIVPAVLAALLFVCWFVTPKPAAEAMALSWAGLERGRTATIWLHMFAHGSLLHVSLNCAALLALSGPLIARLGDPPLSWGRFLYLYFGSGLAGAALFLALNHSAAMLGASGAIFGVFGALARVHPHSGTLVPVKSHRTWLVAKAFVKEHLLMFGLLALTALLWGKSASIAWQAHLGGLLFGVFAASLFLERESRVHGADGDEEG
jgi:membrane associated rhomboid family serine protease